MRGRWIASVAVGLLATTAGPGCQSVGPAAWTSLDPHRGDFSYTAGRATRSFGAAPGTVLTAVVGAMDDLRMQSIRQVNEPGAVILEATTADNRSASVSLKPSPGGTRMDTRIGLLGDEALSRALADRVGIRLASTPESTPAPATESTSATKTTTTALENPYFSRTAVSDEEMLKGMADAHFQDRPSP